MDVHRLKFLNVKPHSILSIAYNGIKESPKIAVSRSDGSIEIWSIISQEDREMTHHVTIPGKKDVTVEKLVWCNHRLFSAGLSGTINEWDQHGLGCIGSVEAMGSPIWCIGADHAHQRLAAGTDNGKICIYDVSHTKLMYIKSLDNQNCRILSLCWHTKGLNLVVGCSDSTARIMDTDNGRCTLRITLDKMADSNTLVWDVLYLSDSTIVTANSNGKVQFWNGQYGTLRHSYQSHLADVFALVADSNEGVVYASGVDSKVVQFKRLVDDITSKWVQCQGVRGHSHDVKSLAMITNGCIVSGGVDTQLILYSIDPFDLTHTTRYSPFSSWGNRFKYSQLSNTLMHQSTDSLRFWRITPTCNQVLSNSCSPDKDALKSLSPAPSDSNISLPSVTSSIESDLLISSGLPVHFLEINTPSVDRILSSAISDDGSICVLSCTDKTWVYKIGSHVICLGSCDLSACSIAIKYDNSEVLLGLRDGGLCKVCVPPSIPSHSGPLTSNRVIGHSGKLSYTFTRIMYSSCGNYCLLVNRKFRILIYDTSTNSCLFKIPRVDDYRSPCVVFDPSQPLLHIYAPSSQELHSFNIKEGSLTSIGSLPSGNKKNNDSSTPCANANGLCVLSSPNYVLAYNTDELILLKNTSNSSIQVPQTNRKRRHESNLSSKYVKHFSQVLFVTPLNCRELLVVEKAWDDVVKELPPVLERKRYAQ